MHVSMDTVYVDYIYNDLVNISGLMFQYVSIIFRRICMFLFVDSMDIYGGSRACLWVFKGDDPEKNTALLAGYRTCGW
jgi:hypothetical protein